MSSKSGYKLVLTPGKALKDVLLLTQRKQLAFVAAQLEPPLSSVSERAQSLLIENGVSLAKAAELARRLEPTALLDRIEYVMTQVATDQKRTIKNPAGYLISFTETEQPIPKTFHTSRQRELVEKRRSEQEAANAKEAERSFAEMQLEGEYEKWCLAQAENHIARGFDADALGKRLKAVSNRLRKDVSLASTLDRMKPEILRSELMRSLKREVSKELTLPSLGEWIAANPQGALF